MSTFIDITPDESHGLLRDYADHDNTTLSARYGLATWTIERFAHEHGLYKDPEGVRRRQSAAAVTAAVMARPAPQPTTIWPTYPGPDYCATCGLTTRHAPGCTGIERRTDPHWRS